MAGTDEQPQAEERTGNSGEGREGRASGTAHCLRKQNVGEHSTAAAAGVQAGDESCWGGNTVLQLEICARICGRSHMLYIIIIIIATSTAKQSMPTRLGHAPCRPARPTIVRFVFLAGPTCWYSRSGSAGRGAAATRATTARWPRAAACTCLPSCPCPRCCCRCCCFCCGSGCRCLSALQLSRSCWRKSARFHRSRQRPSPAQHPLLCSRGPRQQCALAPPSRAWLSMLLHVGTVAVLLGQ